MEIDETFNAVELEKAGNTDKSIPLSKSNQLTESLGIRKEKLSKIYLKKFCGDPISFNTIWESFASAVDDNPSLSDGDKFNYLKNMLEGSAASILKKRFVQPQVIINAHTEGLAKVSAVRVDNV